MWGNAIKSHCWECSSTYAELNYKTVEEVIKSKNFTFAASESRDSSFEAGDVWADGWEQRSPSVLFISSPLSSSAIYLGRWSCSKVLLLNSPMSS